MRDPVIATVHWTCKRCGTECAAWYRGESIEFECGCCEARLAMPVDPALEETHECR
jgi:hypothetical protein